MKCCMQSIKGGLTALVALLVGEMCKPMTRGVSQNTDEADS